MDVYSKKGKLCIGECHPAGKQTIHPITLWPIKEEFQYCHVKPYEEDGVIKHTDNCSGRGSVVDKYTLLTPKIEFQYKDYLKECYGIKKIDDAIKWVLKEKRDSAKDRIMHCAWKAFWEDILKSSDILKPNEIGSGKLSIPDTVIEYYENTCDKKISFDECRKKIEEYISKNSEKWFTINNHNIKIKKYLCS